MLTEGVFLGLAGGVTGAIAGLWGTRLLATLAPTTLPRLETLALDAGVAAIVVATGVLLGLLAAMGPALWATRVSLGSLVATASLRGAASVTPLRRTMIVAQIAISLVLLSAGGLVVRSFERLLPRTPASVRTACSPSRWPWAPGSFANRRRRRCSRIGSRPPSAGGLASPT